MSIKRSILAFTLAVAIVGGGCASTHYVVHPGAVNVFSSQSYDTLVATDAIIQQTKKDIAAGVFPASWMPNVKKALNVLIQAYDVANVSWQAYNASVTPATQTTLQSNLDQLNAATTALSSAKVGAPAPPSVTGGLE